MAQTLTQRQQEKQVQQLSAVQVALSSLVQLPLPLFEQRVRAELLDNAALEEAPRERDLSPYDQGGDDGDEAAADPAEAGYDPVAGAGDAAWGDYASPDDVPEYLREQAEQVREQRERPLVASTSLYEELSQQVGELGLGERQAQLVNYLVGSLDDGGYLRKDLSAVADELAVYHGVEATPAELEEALAQLQALDPAGIGARTLQECLTLQLQRQRDSAARTAAQAIVQRAFDLFLKKQTDRIAQRLALPPEEATAALRLLTRLNPLPGRLLGSGADEVVATVVPDFRVRLGLDGLPEVELLAGDVPALRVSQGFRQAVQQYAGRGDLTQAQHDTYVYARSRVEAATQFLSLLQRRRETLLAVMSAIVALQADFFTHDDEEAQLRPMALRDVAQRAGVDVSTVSRAAGSKYVQTDYGVYALKYFFSGAFVTETGETLEARRVKAALARLIAEEDKRAPLPDEALTAALAAEGMPVARRTVAKYREGLGLPVARLRREP